MISLFSNGVNPLRAVHFLKLDAADHRVIASVREFFVRGPADFCDASHILLSSANKMRICVLSKRRLCTFSIPRVDIPGCIHSETKLCGC